MTDEETTEQLDQDWWGMLVAEASQTLVPTVTLSEKSGFLVGRHSECDIVIEHSQMSKRHCLIFKEAFVGKTGTADCDVYIEDMSTNGTFVNGKRIEKGKRFKLSNGDEIQLAKNKSSSKNKFNDRFWVFRAPRRVLNNAFEDLYSVSKTLGTGNFATVKLATHKSSGEKFAVKILDKKMFEGNPKILQNIQQEIGILMAVNHPCIIRVGGVFDLPKTVNIVMEFAKGGELFDRVVKSSFTEDESRIIMIQLLKALEYLHARQVVHRDLKPENILLTSTSDADLRLKVSDFGLAKLVPDFTSTLCGTPNYVAPEVLTGRNNRAYGSAVDLWSCGVILYICLVGQPPFSDDLGPPSMMDQIKLGKFTFPSPFWDDISDQAKDMIKKLIVVDPSKRVSASEALDHPWIKDHFERLSNNPALAQIPKHETTFISGDTMNPKSREELEVAHSTPEKTKKRGLQAERSSTSPRASLSSEKYVKLNDADDVGKMKLRKRV